MGSDMTIHAMDAWNESAHPRDDHGRFGSGSSSSTAMTPETVSKPMGMYNRQAIENVRPTSPSVRTNEGPRGDYTHVWTAAGKNKKTGKKVHIVMGRQSYTGETSVLSYHDDESGAKSAMSKRID